MLRMSHVISPRLLVLSLVAAAFVLGPATSALGQGTSGELPDPISSRDLDRYARRLELSDQQRQAIDVLHSDYQAAFRSLREGPIEEYLQEHGGGGGFRMFAGADLEAMRESVQDLESVLGRIRTLDNQFFDQVQTVLADEQLERVPAVRRARERARYQRGMSRMAGFMNPGARVDLGAFLDEIDLGPDVEAIVRPVLDTYERRLTTLAQRLHDDATKMPLVVGERMQEAGVSPRSMRDRTQRETVFAIWQESQQNLATQAAELSDLNRRTFGQLMPLLPEPALAKLRREYLSQAYNEAPSDRGPAARHFREALSLESIDHAMRRQIQEQRLAYRTRIDHVVNEMLDAIDGDRRTTRMFRFNADESPEQQKYRETMDELRERFGEINAGAIAALNALLGEETAGTIATRAAETKGDVEETGTFTAVITVAGDGGGAFTAVSGTAINLTLDESMLEFRDPYIPDAISGRELQSYGHRLDVPEEMADVLETLHEDYRTQFDELRRHEIQAVKDLESSMWTIVADEDDDTRREVRNPTPEEVERLYELRRKALAAVNALDARFFEDVAAALLDEEQQPLLQRVQLARQRTVYNRATAVGGGGAFVMMGGPGRAARRNISLGGGGDSAESGVDLSRLVEDLELPEEALESVDPVLFSYEQTITDVFRTHYQASMRFQESMDKLTAESSTNDEEGGRRTMRFRGGGAYREIMDTDGRAEREARQRLVEINRSTLADVSTHLSEDDADRLRRAYNHEAYPGIFRDPRSAEPKIAAALNLPDLSPNQRSELGEVAMAYRAEYDALCEKLVESAVAMGGDGGDFFDRSRWQVMQEHRRTEEKLRFDRDELSDKVLVRLRSLLTPEQIERLGGLEVGPGRP